DRHSCFRRREDDRSAHGDLRSPGPVLDGADGSRARHSTGDVLMRIPLEMLVDGVMHALREEVLPELSSSRARSRLWAALDVLNNLRDRVEEKAMYFRMETESADDALRACAAALCAGGFDGEAATVLRSVEAA